PGSRTWPGRRRHHDRAEAMKACSERVAEIELHGRGGCLAWRVPCCPSGRIRLSRKGPMRALLRDFREIVDEQVEFRELLFQMTARDLLLRYKQTVMGFGWALATPILNTIIFSLVFTRVAPVATRVPYPLFAYCGL